MSKINLHEMFKNQADKQRTHYEKVYKVNPKMSMTVGEHYKNGYSDALSDLQGKVDSLIEAFETAANQLEGVSIAIAIHGQNINTDFFINTYKISADNARDAIAEFKNGGLK